MTAVTTYDIFSGSRDHEPIWLESVDGLENACQKMRDRASNDPGPYFVFCVATQAVLAVVNTSPALQSNAKTHASGS
jgi:hypothetical protein